MKRGAIILGLMWLLLPVVPYIYAGDGREDGSGLAMWGFLGLCAAIICLQLLPALKKLVGFAGEKAQHSEEAKEKTGH